MPLHPIFSITIGRLQLTTANPVAGPQQIVVERDMDIPADTLMLRLTDRNGIRLEDPVNVSLGDDGPPEPVFVGTVVALRSAIAGVEVRALGQMQALLNLRLSTSFDNQSVGNIVRTIMQQAGVSPGQVESGPTSPHFAIDQRLSAFTHLKELANRLGYELYSDRHGRIQFHNPGAVPGLAAREYALGRDILAAVAHQQPVWGAIAVAGESPMSRRGDDAVHWLTPQDAVQQSGQGTPALQVLDPVARTQDLTQQFAAGRLTVASRKAHHIWIQGLGNPTVDLGDRIRLINLPDALMNGTGYIRALRHHLSDTTGLITELKVAIGGGV
jgi:hypothetical protein